MRVHEYILHKDIRITAVLQTGKETDEYFIHGFRAVPLC